jgi:hypothetical protein
MPARTGSRNIQIESQENCGHVPPPESEMAALGKKELIQLLSLGIVIRAKFMAALRNNDLLNRG